MTAGPVACTADQVALANALVDVLAAQDALRVFTGRSVISVAGESGSGKTVTALCLAQALTVHGRPTGVLHQDDYFVLPPATNHANRVLDLANVGPHEVDFARLCSDVEAFRAAANGVTVPQLEYARNRFVTAQRDFATLEVLIVEGTYVVEHVPADARLFLAATSDDTRARRKTRNRDIDSPLVDRVLAIEHPIIAAQVSLAHIVIDRDFRITRRDR